MPAEDPAALADACVELLTDADALRAAYEGALAARSALTWEESARAHEALYGELIGAIAGAS